MSRFIGYARVSREEQNLVLQMNALKSAGCKKEHIFTDNQSYEEYIEKNMPEIIAKEDSTEEVDLIMLNESKLDELISKLQKLKENKEFEFEDSEGDDFAFEFKG